MDRTLLGVILCLSTLCFASQDPGPQKTFGERQVEQMLDDRPDMKDVLSRDDPIYKWVCLAFEGSDKRNRVYWNARMPHGGFPACHTPKFGFYPPQILVSDTRETTGIEKWFAVVFEHFNLDNEVEQRKLLAQITTRDISAEKFADAYVQLERVAEKATVSFLESRLPDTHPLRTCNFMVSSEFAKNRKSKAKWDYSPNKAYYIEYFKSLHANP